MKYFRRYAEAIGFMSALLLCSAPRLAAHDCSGPGDCEVVPPNVDIATGIGAVAAGGAVGWALVRRRTGQNRSPCQDLRSEVAAGAARLQKLEAKAAVTAGVPAEILQAAMAALVAERALQAKRTTALTECEKSAGEYQPVSAQDLLAAMRADQAEFEKLQEQLRDTALDELRKLREFMKSYNDKWAEAMGALDDYLQTQEYLLPDLEKIWEQFSSREDARRIAEALDDAVAAVGLGVGLARGAAGGAFREAARTARQAGGRLEAAAARKAVTEAIEREGAKKVGRQIGEMADEVRSAVRDGRGLGKAVFADDLAEASKNLKPMPGYFDVIIHGDRQSASILRNGQWVDVSPKGLEIAMKAAGYKGGPVRLISCETGGKIVGGTFQRGYADALSKQLKAPVIAPSESAWLWHDSGKVTVGVTDAGRSHWTAYGMRDHGVSSGLVDEETARLLGYAK